MVKPASNLFFLTVGLQSLQSRRKILRKNSIFSVMHLIWTWFFWLQVRNNFYPFCWKLPLNAKIWSLPSTTKLLTCKNSTGDFIANIAVLALQICVCVLWLQHSNPVSSVWLLMHLLTFIICWIWETKPRLSLEMLETIQSYRALQKLSPLCQIFQRPHTSNKFQSNCGLINLSSDKLGKECWQSTESGEKCPFLTCL